MTNFENQCCTQEQAISLHKAGIQQDSLFYWSDVFTNGKELQFCRRHRRCIYNDDNGNFSEVYFPVQHSQAYSAFNTSELGAMLLSHAKGCSFHQPSGKWTHDNTKWNAKNIDGLFLTQAECFADRLLYMIHINPVKYSAQFLNDRLKRFYDIKREV